MKFEELPQIPERWCEFLRGSLPFSPASKSISALIASADRVRSRPVPRDALCRHLADDRALCFSRTLENIRTLQRPESGVVLVNYYPALFGGPAFQLLKCLTAIKLCEELASHNFEAVPVCWICDENPGFFSSWSARILNTESELCSLELEPQRISDSLPQDKIEALLARIEAAGHGEYDPGTLEILRSAFGSEANLVRASARLVAALMKEWGIVVLNAHSLDFLEPGYIQPIPQNAAASYATQYSILPVVATVIDPFEVDSFAAARPFITEHVRVDPAAWPQASATIVDSRSRRILARYGLDVTHLYKGADAIVGELLASMPRGALEKLAGLKREVEAMIVTLRLPDRESASFAKAASSGKEKIAYQLDRLQQKFSAACRRKEETVCRRIRRVCDSLAPNGRSQELELTGIQMPLRYSSAVLHALFERLDIFSLEHQLISMD